MTTEFLSVACGIALSLLLSYVPGLKDKFEALTSQYKQLIVLGLAVVIGLVVFGLSCAGWASGLGLPVLECNASGIQQLITVIFQVAAGAVVTYNGTKYLHKS